MDRVGLQIKESRFPNLRLALTTITTNSSLFTGETNVSSVTASLVAGRVYGVQWTGNVMSSVANDNVNMRIREDSVVGNVILFGRERIPNNVNTGRRRVYYVEYVAAATGNKTFVFTVQRISGSGNISLRADADRPTYFEVKYVTG